MVTSRIIFFDFVGYKICRELKVLVFIGSVQLQ